MKSIIVNRVMNTVHVLTQDKIAVCYSGYPLFHSYMWYFDSLVSCCLVKCIYKISNAIKTFVNNIIK